MRSLFWICIACIGIHSANAQATGNQLADAAASIENPNIQYVPDYVQLEYPMGDVPSTTGVCTDVVIRAFRQIDIDLQKEVHEDMKSAFSDYPQNWGLARPDPNIDHRRVPNLMTYFERRGWEQSISDDATTYLPGDIVAWDLGGGITHIGLVVNNQSTEGYYLIIHNIGGGQVIEDILFSFEIIGHYRMR
ncbi:MAG TPA: DUF1287 domain-containing protein [Flavobacteriales bacterium]|nr:DUF1287 domain-containing protein [Flavobacteriales bacterium]